jgi:hypothetical protein
MSDESTVRDYLVATHGVPEFDADSTRVRIESTIAGASRAVAESTFAGASSARVASTTTRSAGVPSRRPAVTPVLRVALAAAAAILVFVSGIEYGRRLAGPAAMAPAASEPAPDITVATPSLPLAIQSAGSQYVASLAVLSQAYPQLTVEQQRTAREVALAALLGAAIELLRDSGDDDTALRAAADLIADVKANMAEPTAARGTEF